MAGRRPPATRGGGSRLRGGGELAGSGLGGVRDCGVHVWVCLFEARCHFGVGFWGKPTKTQPPSPLCGLFLCLFPDYFRIHFGGGWRKSLPTHPKHSTCQSRMKILTVLSHLKVSHSVVSPNKTHPNISSAMGQTLDLLRTP